MKKIILASNNQHKIKEFKEMLDNYEIISLKDINFCEEINENGNTFAENSLIKVKTIAEFIKKNNIEAYIIADDSGLCVRALNGLPGIHSARFAGKHGDDEANRQKLLNELAGKEDRSAYFVCNIALFVPENNFISVEGRTEGKITEEELGDKSFGYDCLFYSNELDKTFGEASAEEKNSVSHRARAIEKLKEQLLNIDKNC